MASCLSQKMPDRGVFNLTVAASASDATLGSHTGADVQSGVVIDGNLISGTSKYVEDFTELGFDMDLSHHFMALHMSAADGATIVCETVPGSHASAAFNDDDCVAQITENTTGIKVTVTKGDVVEVSNYRLSFEFEPESGE